MGVSKNRGTPKWMVVIENPIEMDDLGVNPIFGKNPHVSYEPIAHSSLLHCNQDSTGSYSRDIPDEALS